MANIAGKDVGTNDLGVLVGGALLFIFSFFHWFGGKVCVDGECGHVGGGISGWSSGFLAWLGIVLGLAAAVLVALRIFTSVKLPELPVSQAMLELGLAALALLLIIIKVIVGYKKSAFGFSASVGRSFGLYLGLIAVAVEAVFAFLSFQASGEKLPWDKGGGTATPPAA